MVLHITLQVALEKLRSQKTSVPIIWLMMQFFQGNWSVLLLQVTISNKENVYVKGKGAVVVETSLGTKYISNVLFMLDLSKSFLVCGKWLKKIMVYILKTWDVPYLIPIDVGYCLLKW